MFGLGRTLSGRLTSCRCKSDGYCAKCAQQREGMVGYRQVRDDPNGSKLYYPTFRFIPETIENISY